jgi:hypothetical protein
LIALKRPDLGNVPFKAMLRLKLRSSNPCQPFNISGKRIGSQRVTKIRVLEYGALKPVATLTVVLGDTSGRRLSR